MSGIVLFRSRLARPISGALSVVLLALSAAAGFHRGDHDALDWLPERFHTHDFRWAADADASTVHSIDHCTACHLGRMLIRLTPPPPALPDAPPPYFAGAARAAAAAPISPGFLSTPRAPPVT